MKLVSKSVLMSLGTTSQKWFQSILQCTDQFEFWPFRLRLSYTVADGSVLCENDCLPILCRNEIVLRKCSMNYMWIHLWTWFFHLTLISTLRYKRLVLLMLGQWQCLTHLWNCSSPGEMKHLLFHQPEFLSHDKSRVSSEPSQAQQQHLPPHGQTASRESPDAPRAAQLQPIA